MRVFGAPPVMVMMVVVLISAQRRFCCLARFDLFCVVSAYSRMDLLFVTGFYGFGVVCSVLRRFFVGHSAGLVWPVVVS